MKRNSVSTPVSGNNAIPAVHLNSPRSQEAEAVAPAPNIATQLNPAGFDEDGRQWVPRRPTEDLLCIPLSVDDLLILHHVYSNLAKQAATRAGGAIWAAHEKRCVVLLRQISELDHKCAQEASTKQVLPRLGAQAGMSGGGRC